MALALYFTLTTDVAEIERLPEHFVLHQNYPNPFNPVTAFRFELPQPSHVRLHIYTIHGQQVATVADASYSAGVHTLSWDASQQASGVYFYRIEIDEQAPGGRKRTQTRKLMVLK